MRKMSIRYDCRFLEVACVVKTYIVPLFCILGCNQVYHKVWVKGHHYCTLTFALSKTDALIQINFCFFGASVKYLQIPLESQDQLVGLGTLMGFGDT